VAGEKEVARKEDLEAHGRLPWQTAHGIWPNITNPTVSTLQSKAKFRAYVSSAQNDLAAGWVKMVANGETYDPGGYYDAATNYRFTAPVSGYYLFTAGVSLTTAVNNQDYYLAFYVNGAAVSQSKKISSYDFNFVGIGHTDIIYLVANQYVEAYINNGGGATTVDVVTGSLESFFAGHILSVA
jgi:hypothetical protein